MLKTTPPAFIVYVLCVDKHAFQNSTSFAHTFPKSYIKAYWNKVKLYQYKRDGNAFFLMAMWSWM